MKTIATLLLFALAALPAVASDPPNFDSGAYDYDAAGNIIRIGDDWYAYDAFGRLVNATAKTTVSPTNAQTFTYDPYGNATKWVTTPSPGGDQLFTVDETTNRTTKFCIGTRCVGFGYDTAGQQTSGLGGTFQWDAVGMMTEANLPSRHEQYVYDANDERIVTISATKQTRLHTLRDLANKPARELVYDEVADSWKWSKDYVFLGSALFAAYVAGEPGTGPQRHYHLDHLGTPRLITDGGGYALSRHTYWPFGQEAPGSKPDPTDRLRFTGHERDSDGVDPEKDLDYMHARFYMPVAGKFLSVDPVLDIQTALWKPQNWNRYSYAFNSPLTYKDPDGRLVNLASMLEIDRNLLISQLRDKTGLDLDYKNGLLVSNGVLKDSTGKTLGSATARADLTKAISATKTYYGISRNNSPTVNMGQRVGPHLNLDFADIAQVNTDRNDAATFDAASIFLHELSHAFGLIDPFKQMLKVMPSLKGEVVDRDNKIRSELGLPSRSQYLTLKDQQGRYYIPFANGPVYVPSDGDH